jgi:hypothetical protein
LGDVQSRANSEIEAVRNRMAFNEAAAKAGDGPIPSADEALKLLKANPNLEYRQRLFGDNPFAEIINQHRAQKNSTGLTRAQEAKAKAEADTTRRLKRQLTPGPVKSAKPAVPGELKDEQLSEGIFNIPINRAFPGAR